MVTKSVNIAGTGAKVSLGTAIAQQGVRARALQLLPEAGNSGVCRLGGPEVSSTVGFPLPHTQTAPLYLPYTSVWTDMYEFDNMFVYVANGDTLDLLYEQG